MSKTEIELLQNEKTNLKNFNAECQMNNETVLCLAKAPVDEFLNSQVALKLELLNLGLLGVVSIANPPK